MPRLEKPAPSPESAPLQELAWAVKFDDEDDYDEEYVHPAGRSTTPGTVSPPHAKSATPTDSIAFETDSNWSGAASLDAVHELEGSAASPQWGQAGAAGEVRVPATTTGDGGGGLGIQIGFAAASSSSYLSSLGAKNAPPHTQRAGAERLRPDASALQSSA
eukprot:SAG11_NODE_605_length_8236_cov_3.988571_8_plen_161_part_00